MTPAEISPEIDDSTRQKEALLTAVSSCRHRYAATRTFPGRARAGWIRGVWPEPAFYYWLADESSASSRARIYSVFVAPSNKQKAGTRKISTSGRDWVTRSLGSLYILIGLLIVARRASLSIVFDLFSLCIAPFGCAVCAPPIAQLDFSSAVLFLFCFFAGARCIRAYTLALCCSRERSRATRHFAVGTVRSFIS